MRLFLLTVLAGSLLAACGPTSSPEETERAIAESERLLAELEEQYPSTRTDLTWEYETQTDPMTDRVTRIACIDSRNPLVLSAPYEPTRLRLCLRDHPQHGRDAYVHMLKRGQFLYRSYDTGTVKVRFDSGPVENFSAVGAADGSSEVFFIQNRDRFERRVASADVVIIQPEVYQAGSQAIYFDIKGFSWPTEQGS